METTVANIINHIGTPFIYENVVDDVTVRVEGISTFVSRTNSGDTGVGDYNIGYIAKDGEVKDFYAFGTEQITLIK